MYHRNSQNREAAPLKKYNSFDASLLIEAIQTKNTDLLSTALSNNADPNLFDGVLLRLAATRGDYDAAEMLVKAGADVTIIDNMPLKNAAKAGHLNVASLLLKAGATFQSFTASDIIHPDVAPLHHAWMLKTKIDQQLVPNGLKTVTSL